MATVNDLISGSLRLANILGEGQTASGEQAANALTTLNDMIQAWNLDGLMLYGTTASTGTLVVGQDTYTVGSGGNFTFDRPVRISSMYQTYQGVSIPIIETSYEEYSLITLKTQTSPIQRFYVYVNTAPLGTLIFWPVPSSANVITVTDDRVIAEFSSISTTLTFPPGYNRALRANLAMELCPEYGKEPSPSLVKMASESKADVRKANWTQTASEFDDALVGKPSGIAAFYSGY
jgi:hypothetical protein